MYCCVCYNSQSFLWLMDYVNQICEEREFQCLVCLLIIIIVTCLTFWDFCPFFISYRFILLFHS